MSRASNNAAANNSSVRKTASRETSSERPSLRERMSQDLQLRGMSPRTQKDYLREVRKLACHDNSPPDQRTERQVGDYLLYLINDCDFAPGSLGVAYSGIKFFYTFTEPRDWDVLKKLRRPKQKTLPSVLTIDQVHRLIAAVKQHRNTVYFWTVYTLGLRLEEGLHLQVGDLDAQRMMVHVHRGKGAKDRYLPLPKCTLAILRGYWSTHRNPLLLFPAIGRNKQAASTTTRPMDATTVQGCMQRVVEIAAQKEGLDPHVAPRHCHTSFRSRRLVALDAEVSWAQQLANDPRLPAPDGRRGRPGTREVGRDRATGRGHVYGAPGTAEDRAR